MLHRLLFAFRGLCVCQAARSYDISLRSLVGTIFLFAREAPTYTSKLCTTFSDASRTLCRYAVKQCVPTSDVLAVGVDALTNSEPQDVGGCC